MSLAIEASQACSLYLFFDGTGCNRNDSVARQYGQTVIARAAEVAPAAELDALRPETWPTNFSGNTKFYFPGPGANACDKSDGSIHFATPGSAHPAGFLQKGIGLSRLASGFFRKTLSQITGKGVEHNQELALAAVTHAIENSPKDQPIEIKIAGYSRGGITATSVSHRISQYLMENENQALQGRVKITNLVLVDPVYGADKGKIANKKFVDSDPKRINPYQVGLKVEQLDYFCATEERRAAFKPQLLEDCAASGRQTDRPLFVNGKTRVNSYSFDVDHGVIAYMQGYKKYRFPEAEKVAELTGKALGFDLLEGLELNTDAKVVKSFPLDSFSRLVMGDEKREVVSASHVFKNMLQDSLSQTRENSLPKDAIEAALKINAFIQSGKQEWESISREIDSFLDSVTPEAMQDFMSSGYSLPTFKEQFKAELKSFSDSLPTPKLPEPPKSIKAKVSGSRFSFFSRPATVNSGAAVSPTPSAGAA